jgi:hypothetical protein
MLMMTLLRESENCFMFRFGIEESTSYRYLTIWVKNNKYSSLFSMTTYKSSFLALTYCSYVFFCISLDKIDVVTLLACIMYKTQCARVSVEVRMKSLKN